MNDVEISVLFDEGFENSLPEAWLSEVAQGTLQAEGKTNIEMGILITSQEIIQELNHRYLMEDHPTDVLSFAMLESEEGGEPFPCPEDGVQHLGEVIISYPQAKQQATEHGHSPKKETAVLLIHGILHLLGYDHATPEGELAMKEREAAALKLVAGQLA
jgi:probable rRNA maturation factor